MVRLLLKALICGLTKATKDWGLQVFKPQRLLGKPNQTSEWGKLMFPKMEKNGENCSRKRFMSYISDYNMTVSIVRESICQNGCVDKKTFVSQQLLWMQWKCWMQKKIELPVPVPNKEKKTQNWALSLLINKHWKIIVTFCLTRVGTLMRI